jgi:hypothetical protein
MWEVHPITRIEIFKNGQWVNLDDVDLERKDEPA